MGSVIPMTTTAVPFCYSLCCLSDRLGAAVVAVADVVGMEGLSATVLSVAGAAPELSDRASEPYNKWNDASPVTALIAVTMSACSGLTGKCNLLRDAG